MPVFEEPDERTVQAVRGRIAELWHKLRGCGPFIPVFHGNKVVWMCGRCGDVHTRKVVPQHGR